MRSLLFVPADSPRKLEKSLESGADALIIDLEDAVALAAKPAARVAAHDFLRATRAAARRPMLIVRVNALDTGLVDADGPGDKPPRRPRQAGNDPDRPSP